MMLHSKYCSISIAGSWGDNFKKIYLTYSPHPPLYPPNSLSPLRVNLICINLNLFFPRTIPVKFGSIWLSSFACFKIKIYKSEQLQVTYRQTIDAK